MSIRCHVRTTAMGWQQTPYVYPALVAALVSGGLAVYGLAYRHRRDPTVTVDAFVVLVAAIAVWAGSEAVAFARTDFESKLLAYRLGQLGVVAVPPAWTFFALAYTGRERRITRYSVAAALVVPVLTLVSVWLAPYPFAVSEAHIVTVGAFRYLYVTVGPVYWLFRAYSYLLSVLGSALVITSTLRMSSPYGNQAALVVGASLLPFVGELASTFGVLPDDHVNYAAMFLSVSALAFGVAVFRYHLLDVLPVARTTVVDNMRDGILVTDERGRIIDLNPQARRMLNVEDGTAAGRVSAIVPAYDRLDDDGASVVETTTPDRRRVELSRTPITRGDRRYGWIVTVRDVTTRRQNERRIDRQRRRLEQLASTVSHDLEGPIDVGRKWLDVLSDAASDDGGVDDALLREGLDELEHANDRIDTITDDLAALTRAESQELDIEPLALSDVARVAWHTAETPGLSLDVVASASVRGDRGRLLRLFENLFRNVADHADCAETVRVGPLPDGFFVEDDGPGVPEDERERVLRHGYSSTDGGTGLGLSVVQAIAEAHGWQVRLTDGESGGARFEFVRSELDE
jgi:signal transduction histidine kinase